MESQECCSRKGQISFFEVITSTIISCCFFFTCSSLLSLPANGVAGLPWQSWLSPRKRCGPNAHPWQLENRHGILPTTLYQYFVKEPTEKSLSFVLCCKYIFIFFCSSQDQLNRNKVPEWQRIAGKAAKEVEKFAKEKADLVLMHWRDKMGIAQKEVRLLSPSPFLSRT